MQQPYFYSMYRQMGLAIKKPKQILLLLRKPAQNDKHEKQHSDVKALDFVFDSHPRAQRRICFCLYISINDLEIKKPKQILLLLRKSAQNDKLEDNNQM